MTRLSVPTAPAKDHRFIANLLPEFPDVAAQR
jgi:hypothetical protein